MPYFGPSTEKTAHSCDKCKHFGGWVERDDGAAWCKKNQLVQALSYQGCCDWKEQPEGWMYPPELDPIVPEPRRNRMG